MEAIIEILAGVVGSFLTYYILSRAINRSTEADTAGELFFGRFLVGTSSVCTLIGLGMLWVLFFTDHGGQEVPIILLIAMFGVFAIYGWAEVIWTKGFFNNESLTFQSIWKGRRRYQWSELRSVKFNENLHWYVLRFRHGRTVRISIYLHGHGSLLDKCASLGHDF
ncbi:PH domain-containing protein [Marinobacter sp.]|uniref:PH domain-containing protein n=1 Tax=Marinobacter sp. TaxID=50741 RepID=UPI003A8F2975